MYVKSIEPDFSNINHSIEVVDCFAKILRKRCVVLEQNSKNKAQIILSGYIRVSESYIQNRSNEKIKRKLSVQRTYSFQINCIAKVENVQKTKVVTKIINENNLDHDINYVIDDILKFYNMHEKRYGAIYDTSLNTNSTSVKSYILGAGLSYLHPLHYNNIIYYGGGLSVQLGINNYISDQYSIIAELSYFDLKMNSSSDENLVLLRANMAIGSKLLIHKPISVSCNIGMGYHLHFGKNNSYYQPHIMTQIFNSYFLSKSYSISFSPGVYCFFNRISYNYYVNMPLFVSYHF